MISAKSFAYQSHFLYMLLDFFYGCFIEVWFDSEVSLKGEK